MRSMTGFGRTDYRDDAYDISVAIKTVNHRYKDFYIRMPHTLDALEHRLRGLLSQYISRGHADVTIRFERLENADQHVTVNRALARDYIAALNELKTLDATISDEIGIDLVARFPDVITVSEDEGDEQAIWQVLSPVVSTACENLIASREKDGKAMQDDMLARCDLIEKIANDIRERAPEMLTAGRERLRQTVSDYLSETPIDEGRLLTEIAVMSDKLDITEELTRLSSHTDRFKKICAADEPIGRKLDFLVQEMNREVNTIGSKQADIQIANDVVELKTEIEKIREQIQNIE